MVGGPKSEISQILDITGGNQARFSFEPAREPGTQRCVCHLVAALPSVFVVCLLRPWDTMAIQSFRGVIPL